MRNVVESPGGHIPVAGGAFILYGMFTGKVTSPDFTIKYVVEDIEKLKRQDLNPQLEVTAVSVHACAYIPEYTILRSGGSFGIGYGPIVVAKKMMDLDQLKKSKIAIPGKMTSAFLLLQLMLGKFDFVEMNFSEIPNAIKNQKADAGLVIHETQLSYDQENLTKILDVGEWWDKKTGGLPVPLGINVIKNQLGKENIKKFDTFLRNSIKYGLEHEQEAIDYAMEYSRGKSRQLIEKFVKMYVNDVTIDMGNPGEKSIRRLFELAAEKNLVSNFDLRIAE